MIDSAILRPARTAFLIGLGVFVLGGILWRCGSFQEGELWVYDHFVELHSNPNATDPRIVLVELTEKDIDKIDYPLRDSVLSEVLEKIEVGAPSTVGLDLYRDLPEPRNGSERDSLNKTLLKYPNIVGIFLFGSKADPFSVPPPPVLRDDPSRYGFNNFLDVKVIRRGFLLWPLHPAKNESPYYSFPFILAQLYLGNLNVPMSQEDAGIRLGKAVIPELQSNDGGYVNDPFEGYAFMQDFRGPQKFDTLSISDVLALKDPSVFKDKIVLIGIDAGSSNDTFATPIFSQRASEKVPGVLIHAQIVNQLLRAAIDGDKPTSSFRPWFSWLWMALGCAAGIVAGLYIRSHILFAFAVATGIALIVIAAWLCFLAGYWILVFGPVVVFLASSMLVKAYAATYEEEQRQNLMKLFSQHVSPEIAEEIWTQRETFLQGGRPAAQKLIVTVLFTDLKNYSTISEKMTPAELIAWVNQCQSALAQHVGKNGGIVNCYMGDGMMAVFGVPVPRKTEAEMRRDAINAVTCALGMGQEIRQMNARWRTEGKPLAGLRVGIYTGEAMAGMLGSDDHLAYSVIGDTVNTASRLESVDKDGVLIGAIDACRILVGSLTYQYISGQYSAQHVGSVNLKGKAATTEVYKVLDSPLEDEQHPPKSK
jgi:adenylate cyclase